MSREYSKKQYTMRLDTVLIRKIKVFCAERDITVTALITNAIIKEMNDILKKEKKESMKKEEEEECV